MGGGREVVAVGVTWKKSVSPVLPNDLHVQGNGY